ncbi:hypothetical protein DPMN_185341 [Dreissena polymorpha]|uniref:Uncharacterized protein n=1 Tax=Dreissena polymorpha TaxID=45954 RepID=A0A9D4I8M6_DREPO|nr:hypothetical protein DPMN_185341 [Dreissena polymorpha]
MVYPGEESRLSPVVPRLSPGESRQRPGIAPVVAGSAQVEPRWKPAASRQSPGIP